MKWYPRSLEIHRRMTELKLTQRKLSDKSGVPYVTVRRIMNPNDRGSKKKDALDSIAKVLMCSIEEIASRDAMPRSADAKTVAQVLDLRSYGTGKKEPETPLTCYYLFRHFPDCREMDFHAATTSHMGVKVSVPAEWHELLHIDVEMLEEKPHDDKHKKRYCIHAALSEDAVPNDIEFEYEIMFKDAYTSPEQWWYHTHMEFDADELVMILLFPDTRTPDEIIGSSSNSQVGDLKEHRIQPTLTKSGTVLYWRIPRPQQGQTYELSWEW